jgi:hypothetical protein
MRRQIVLPIKFVQATYDNWKSLVVEFSDPAVVEWCIGLILLRDKLITALAVTTQARDFDLEIQLLSKGLHSKLDWAERAVKMSISSNELEYCLKFFLMYYRDNGTGVDHIDIEYYSEDSEEGKGYVTMKVEKTRSTISGDEARNKLGL